MKTQTLEEAAAYVRENAATGVICPCCEKKVKIASTRLDKRLLKFLAYLQNTRNQRGKTAYASVRDIYGGKPGAHAAGDYGRLVHWGLIESNPNATGEWRLTYKGYMFMTGMVKIQPILLTLNNKAVGFKGDPISFQEISA